MNREEAIKILENATIEPTWGGSFRATSEALDMAIEALQTDIVRCGECKFCKIAYPLMCMNGKALAHIETDTDFCSYGERGVSR